MGYFRFLLASFVAFSHANGYLPINLGASAVIVFYFISGYLMSISYENFKNKTSYAQSSFYIDRVLRLFPSYIFVFTITIIFFSLFDLNNATNRMIDNNSIFDLNILNELFLIPNNYSRLTTSFSTNILPPAWSLGAELQFYLLFPLFVLIRIKKRIIIFLVLVIFHLLALSNSNYLFDYISFCNPIINEGKCWIDIHDSFKFEIIDSHVSDLFGYRLIFFTFSIFLFGNICYECFTRGGKYKYFIYTIIFIYIFCFFLIFSISDLLKNKHAIEVLFALAFLTPLSISILEKVRMKKKVTMLDSFLGKLAYPVFLTHFLAIWSLDLVLLEGKNNIFFTPLTMILCIFYSLVVMYFQNRVDKLRYGIRGFKRVTKDYH